MKIKKILIKVAILVLIVSVVIYVNVHIINEKKEINEVNELSFSGLDDVKLQDYLIENLSAGINADFTSDDYVIQDIATTYVSKEYIEELNYNTQSNVYFGYTLDELSETFNGKKYVFQVGENNETTVAEFEEFQDNYMKMLKNIAIGSGVILVCVTVSVLSTGTAVGAIFLASAETATKVAVSSMAVTGVISSAVEYYKTGDIEKSLEKGALEGTESFKWGAILGGVTGRN